MKGVDTARTEILLEGLDDYIGIWEIAFVMDESLPGTEKSEVRAASLDFVKEVLESGLMEPGYPRDGRFRALDGSSSEILARVRHEWDDLSGDLPDVGEGMWFNLTEEGRVYAHRLDELDQRE
jgi:hypothetical protein